MPNNTNRLRTIIMKIVVLESLAVERKNATHIVVFNYNFGKSPSGTILVNHHFMAVSQRGRFKAVGQWIIKRKEIKCNFS